MALLLLGILIGAGAASAIWAAIGGAGRKKLQAQRQEREQVMLAVGELLADADDIEANYRSGTVVRVRFAREMSEKVGAVSRLLRTNMHLLEVFFVKYAEQQVAEYMRLIENPERRKGSSAAVEDDIDAPEEAAFAGAAAVDPDQVTGDPKTLDAPEPEESEDSFELPADKPSESEADSSWAEQSLEDYEAGFAKIEELGIAAKEGDAALEEAVEDDGARTEQFPIDEVEETAKEPQDEIVEELREEEVCAEEKGYEAPAAPEEAVEEEVIEEAIEEAAAEAEEFQVEAIPAANAAPDEEPADDPFAEDFAAKEKTAEVSAAIEPAAEVPAEPEEPSAAEVPVEVPAEPEASAAVDEDEDVFDLSAAAPVPIPLASAVEEELFATAHTDTSIVVKDPFSEFGDHELAETIAFDRNAMMAAYAKPPIQDGVAAPEADGAAAPASDQGITGDDVVDSIDSFFKLK